MTHKKFDRLLILSVNGALGERDEEDLTRHLETCAECRSELRKLQQLSKYAAAVRSDLPVDDALLAEARHDFHALLRYENRTQRLSFRQWSIPAIAPSLKMGIAAAVVFGLGFGLGSAGLLVGPRHTEERTTAQVQTASVRTPVEGRTKIANVQFLDRGEKSGVVEFSFDAVTPVRMRGNVDDPTVQKVLASALLNDDNPGVRLSAVNALGVGPHLKADSALKSALIKALKSDPNVGVRKQALLALKSMPMDSSIKKAFLAALGSDANPGIRIAAINALDVALNQPGAIDPAVRDVLQRDALNDKNDYVRLKAKAVLSENQ